MIDRITVSVIQHRLESIVTEMGEAMLRTAYSQILNSSRDFSTAVFDAEGRLAAQAEHVPIHVGALPWAVAAIAEAFRDRIRPGDLYLLNDPYHGGNHLPDLTVLLPVFVGGQLAFWSINRAHQHDIGGATHGTYNPGATEIWQEGIRIPPLKLYDAGELRDDVMQMVATNVRHPRDFLGDLRAMIGSARVGERRLLRLCDEYGVETTTAAVGEILDSAERQARACVRTWKDGVFHGEALMDDDGHDARDIWIRAKITKRGDALEVDLSDSHPQVTGFINSSWPNTMSSVHMAFAYLIDPRTPKNEGTFRPVTVKAKQGTIVWPHPPAPVTLCTNHCAQDIMEAMMRALAGSCPDRTIAGWSKRFRIAIQGMNPRTTRPFIWHLFHARGGGGASSAGDGWCTAGEGQAAGGIKFGSVEVAETRFPLFFELHEFRPDSGGAGRFRGGVGSVLEFHMETTTPGKANTAGEGVKYPPHGLLGGADGTTHHYRLVSGRRTTVLRTKSVGVPVMPGDRFLIVSSGGGGYGDPRARDPRAVAEDVANAVVTAPRARRDGPRRGGGPAPTRSQHPSPSEPFPLATARSTSTRGGTGRQAPRPTSARRVSRPSTASVSRSATSPGRRSPAAPSRGSVRRRSTARRSR
ncbi:MAG: hydantoinase B/oxoprolinase family protein [Candidatus Rokubacteria bacterium]|nr:hydantoinase B/oxoprolinase family protein [Candidatus Rokubacteria bacterium]